MSSVIKIHTRFKGFEKDLKDVWESYCLVEHLASEGHKLLKAERIAPFEMPSLFGGKKQLQLNNTLGAISHLKDKSQPRACLLEAVAYFEDYLSWLVETVITDYPTLLKSNNPQSDKEEVKLINLIVDCSDRSEMLEHLIEEKVRGIFYGNPIEIFTKTKSKINFGNYFSEKCSIQLEQYAEITARRNVIAHNNGRVDRKYMREVKNSTFKLGQAISVPGPYLRESIALLLCLSARATELVIINHYKASIAGKLAARIAKCKCLPPI